MITALTIIAGILKSTIFGSFIGFIGSYFTRKDERETLKVKHLYDLEKRRIDLEEVKLKQSHELQLADKHIKEVESEYDKKIDLETIKGEQEAFKTSLLEQTKDYKSRFIDVMRGTMRPAITLYLLCITSYFALSIGQIVGGFESLGKDELLSIYKGLIEQMTMLMAIAVTWWFGTRPTSQNKK
jgi:hypothetical protein